MVSHPPAVRRIRQGSARRARAGCADADSSTSRRVAQSARIARRSGRPRGRRRRSRARGAAPGAVSPASDQRRRQPDAAAVGSDAAGRPDRRASGACGGRRNSHGAGRRQHHRAAPVVAARRRGPVGSDRNETPTSRRLRGWCARSRSTAALVRRCGTVDVRSSSRRPVRTKILTASLAAYARALFFAGELDEAWAMAVRTWSIRPSSGTSRACRSPLNAALVGIERGRRSLHAATRSRGGLVGRIGTSRSWPGPTRPPLGSVLVAEGSLVEVEQDLAARWSALRRPRWRRRTHSGCRPPPPRVVFAAAAWGSRADAALCVVGAWEPSTAGRSPLAGEVQRELEAATGRAAAAGKCSTRRPGPSRRRLRPATDLSMRDGERICPRRTRSARRRGADLKPRTRPGRGRPCHVSACWGER